VNWWVVNQVSLPGGPRGPQQTNYVVVQASTRPPNTVAGPFATEADAQAWQTSGNTAGNSPGSAAGGVASAAASSISSSILGPLFQGNIWLRVAEVLIGVVLIGIGLNAMLKGKPLAVVTSTAGLAGKVVP